MLSDREIQILKQVYYTAYNGAVDFDKVAIALKISKSTVKNHLSKAYLKMNVRDITAAIVKAKDVLDIL